MIYVREVVDDSTISFCSLIVSMEGIEHFNVGIFDGGVVWADGAGGLLILLKLVVSSSDLADAEGATLAAYLRVEGATSFTSVEVCWQPGTWR